MFNSVTKRGPMEYVLIIIYANEWANAICRWPYTTYKQPCMKWNLLKITRTTSRYVGILLILLQPQHPPFKPKRFHHHIDKSLLFHVQDRGIFFINSRVWISFAFLQCFLPEDCYQNVSFTGDPLLPTSLLHTINLHILQSEPLSHHHHHPHHPIRSAVSTSPLSSITGKILLDHESSDNAKC